MFEGRVVPVSVPEAVAIVMFDVPSNETPLIVRGVARAVAVPAFPETFPVTFPVTFPIREPVNVVAVTADRPESVGDAPPREMLVEPIRIDEFVRAEFGIAEKFVPVSVGVDDQVAAVVPPVEIRTWPDEPEEPFVPIEPFELNVTVLFPPGDMMIG
jgi:hypothetical protein